MAQRNSLTSAGTRLPSNPANDAVAAVLSDTGADAGANTSWQRFSVHYEFPVRYTRDVLAIGNHTLREVLSRLEPAACHRLIVFIDAGLATAWPAVTERFERYCLAHSSALELVCTPMIVPGGEIIKQNWASLAPLQEAVATHGIDRHSCIVGIGGGAVLDAVGLVAATAHRGIRHVRIPTTVLAQNDSGVGVKNAINQFGQKNYLGTFAPPFGVINDAELLQHLPPEEHIAGMAEAVKVALIRDADFFDWLELQADALAAHAPEPLHQLIRRCAELHMRQIGRGGDPFELGSARPLDFGHWAAHRLETLSGHTLRHGFAVAIGIALDARYSVLAGFLQAGEDERIACLLDRLGFTLWHPLLGARDASGTLQVVAGLEQFRAHLGGELTITLLAAIGTGHEVNHMSETMIVEAVSWLKSRGQA